MTSDPRSLGWVPDGTDRWTRTVAPGVLASVYRDLDEPSRWALAWSGAEHGYAGGFQSSVAAAQAVASHILDVEV